MLDSYENKGLPGVVKFQLRPDCHKGVPMALGTEYFTSRGNRKDKQRMKLECASNRKKGMYK